MIGVKKRWLLCLPNLFVLYIDEISNYIEGCGGSAVHLAWVDILISLYADDIVLISISQDGLQTFKWFKLMLYKEGFATMIKLRNGV